MAGPCSGSQTRLLSTLDLIDLETIPQADRAEAARRTIQEQAQRVRDTRGPLFRPVLIRLGPDEHELLVMVHHIVADGWSVSIITRELMALYEAGRTGQPLLLPEPPLVSRFCTLAATVADRRDTRDPETVLARASEWWCHSA